MSAIIFCGPTLAEQDRAPFADLEFRSPVRQGELFAATRQKPRAIGIIDGYFDGQPAVWHKEILWALTQGIAVFGASSMGALRAAELHAFGMRGVGKIFEAYRDGALTDDDEVALIHGPAETGYLRLSEPMVNIRATLDLAVAQGILDRPTRDRLTAAAKAQFYQQRSWAGVLATVGDPANAARLSAWLRSGRVDQKREDALLMLKEMEVVLRQGKGPEPVNFSFEWTENWDNAPWRSEMQADGRITGEQEAILDELRLNGTYVQLRKDALLRLLAGGESAAMEAAPDRQAVARAKMEFRSKRGLLRQSDVVAWAKENGTDVAGFERMMADDAEIETLARLRDAELQQGMLDRLRELDLYAQTRDRALAKQGRPASGAAARMPRVLLAGWHFEQRLAVPVPENLSDYASSIGVAGVEKFYELLAVEFTFAGGHTSPE